MTLAVLDEAHHVHIIDDPILWAMWMEDTDRRVARHELPNGYLISTVFLGVDHGWGGIPLWFETMVFHGNTSDLDMERYTTWDQAVKGHRLMVDKWS